MTTRNTSYRENAHGMGSDSDARFFYIPTPSEIQCPLPIILSFFFLSPHQVLHEHVWHSIGANQWLAIRLSSFEYA